MGGVGRGAVRYGYAGPPSSTENTRGRSIPRSEAAIVTRQPPPPKSPMTRKQSLLGLVHSKEHNIQCFQNQKEGSRHSWQAVRLRRITMCPAQARSIGLQSRPPLSCSTSRLHFKHTCFRRSNSASLLLSLQKKYVRDSDHGTTFRTAPLASMRPGVSCRSANCTATFEKSK